MELTRHWTQVKRRAGINARDATNPKKRQPNFFTSSSSFLLQPRRRVCQIPSGFCRLFQHVAQQVNGFMPSHGNTGNTPDSTDEKQECPVSDYKPLYPDFPHFLPQTGFQ